MAKRDERFPIDACKVITQHDWCVEGCRCRLEIPNCARRVITGLSAFAARICAPAAATGLPVFAGGFVGAYTITDALGARSAGSPNGYMVWVTLLYAVLVAGCFWFLPRGTGPAIATPTLRIGVAAGLMSYGSSWLVVWALTLAPMALVSALRETSIVFAVIIGVVFLQERLSLVRLASITTTLVGTTLLTLSR